MTLTRNSCRAATPVILALALAACAGDAPGSDTEAAAATVESAIQQARQLNASRGTEPLKAVDLAERLPAEVDGMPQTEKTHQDGGTVGVSVAVAHAKYAEGARRLTVTLTDMGTMSGAMGAGLAWTMTNFDRTRPDGHERTVMIDGFKGFESVSREAGVLRTELAVLVHERFLIQLEGREVDMDILRRVLSGLDLRSLPEA